MKTLKKLIPLALSLVLTLTCFTACSPKKTGEVKAIRYLNFKPEIADVYSEIAKKYKEEKGITVIVETAASGTYEQTLMAKMSTDEAPTIFQINGPRGFAAWKDFCGEITGTEIYKHLTDKDLAIKSEGKAYGLPYAIEGYGIIVNKAIMDKYFALENRETRINSLDEIKSFAALKAVVEDMQKRKSELGIEGVFASTSLKSGEDWRWQTHLANLPIYSEFDKNDVDLTSNETRKITFEFADEFKNIFDLYINNSTVQSTKLGTKTVADSMAEFALGKCAMVQNGNWAWSQISNVKGNTVKAENVKFLPIYMGLEDEKNQGLCIGTENFLCINSQASEEERKAAADFIYWLYSSKTGKKFVTNELGFIAPFDTFEDDEKPTDPLAQETVLWMEKDDIDTIPWNFTLFPSLTFKERFGSALLQYAQGKKSFGEVKKQVTDDWARESEALEF